MFDIGWSEIMVIAAVAIIVVGPKELPRMLRTFGKTMGTVRRTANDFKRQFDQALREAELDAGLDEAKASVKSIGNPLADLKKDLSAPVISSAPRKADPKPHEAEPLKTGPTDSPAFDTRPGDTAPEGESVDLAALNLELAEPSPAPRPSVERGSDAA